LLFRVVYDLIVHPRFFDRCQQPPGKASPVNKTTTNRSPETPHNRLINMNEVPVARLKTSRILLVSLNGIKVHHALPWSTINLGEDGDLNDHTFFVLLRLIPALWQEVEELPLPVFVLIIRKDLLDLI